MNWKFALYELRRCRKITRPNWEAGNYWELSKDGFERIICQNGTHAKVHVKQLKADDWVLFKENRFVGKYFEFNVNEHGFINQLRNNVFENHQWQNEDIEAFEKAIKRARELRCSK